MIDDKYRAWIISFGLHSLLFALLFKFRVPVYPQTNVPIMEAYVVVNLSTSPHVKSGQKNLLLQQSDLNQQSQPAASASDAVKALEISEQPEIKTKQPMQVADLLSKQHGANISRRQPEPAEPTDIKPLSHTKFKPLDPYAKLPNISSNIESKQAQILFGHSSLQDEKELAGYNRITVPKAHVKENNSEVIAVSAGGTKRIEKWQGKCYYIDLATVFGQSGMPQGRPRLCPGDKSDDQILLGKSMKKWERVSRTK